MRYLIIGKFVTKDNIEIPGSSIPGVSFLYVDPFNPTPTEYSKMPIKVGDDGTFILPVETKILGYASTIPEITEIISKLQIFIPENAPVIPQYKKPISIKDTNTIRDEIINGKSKFQSSGDNFVLNLGDIVLTYATIPTTPPIPPPLPTITFSDIPVAADASLLFNPSTASFFIFKGTIKDDESKLPIPDITVFLSSVNFLSRGNTDADGTFYIPTEKSTLTELSIISTDIYEPLDYVISPNKSLIFNGYQETTLDPTLTPSPTYFPVFTDLPSDFFLKKKQIEEEVIDESELATEDDVRKLEEPLSPLPALNATPIPNNIPPSGNPTINPTIENALPANAKNKIRKVLVGTVVNETGKGIEKATVTLKYYPFDIGNPNIKPLLIQQIQLLSPFPLPLDVASNTIDALFRGSTPEQAMIKFTETTGVDLTKKIRVATNSTGGFEIALTKKNGNEKINLQGASIEVEFPNYNKSTTLLTNLNSSISTVPYKNGKTLTTTQYRAGRIALVPTTSSPINEEEVKTRIKRQAATSDEEGTPEQKLTKLNIRKFNSALDKLIPFLTSLLIPFGQSAVTAAFGNGKIEKTFCPSPERLTAIINARNSVATQVNILYNGLRVLTQLSNTTDIFITSLTTALQAYPLIPIPAQILTVGAISLIEDRKKSLEEDLKIRRVLLRGITRIIVYCVAILAYVITILTIIDRLIQGCAEEQNIPFIALNSEITNITNPVSNELIENPPTYKGFKLEIKLDPTNNLSYPRRYAQALNLQGVPVLKTDSSFASDPQILINQLKFIIDSDPNLTAG